jgi:hypothetical protein
MAPLMKSVTTKIRAVVMWPMVASKSQTSVKAAELEKGTQLCPMQQTRPLGWVRPSKEDVVRRCGKLWLGSPFLSCAGDLFGLARSLSHDSLQVKTPVQSMCGSPGRLSVCCFMAP